MDPEGNLHIDMSALSFASTVILTGVVVCGVAKAQSTPDPSASDKMAYWSVQRRGANYGPVRLRPADLQAAVNAGIDFLRLRDSLRSTSRDFLIGDADRYQGINKGRFAYPDRMPAGNDSTAVWNIEKLRAIVEPVRAFAARYDVPKHRIISSEFWCDRRVDGAALYLADEMRIYNELGWHWAFYGFRGEGAWTGLDYEIPLDARIAHLWDAEKRGEDLEPLKPRRDNPVWAVIQRELIAGSPTATAPVFTDVFRSGAEGYASIRIPAVLVTKTGTVLAFAEGRRRPADQAENDIVMKRSTDGGKNWSSLRVLHDDGAHSLNNPTVVQEQVSGRIFVWYQRIPSHLKERSQSTATGLEGPDIYRNLILTSDDDGATWSTPQDMTATTKRPERATTIASGPGIGIQLTRGQHRGRLIIPFNEGPYGVWQNYAVFSDDAGKTWRFGADVPGALIPDGKGGHRSRINEAQVAELSDGSVRLDSRQFAGATVRKTAVSRDGGATWSPAVELPEVTDPSCMAGLLRYSFDDAAGRGRLLHTGPDSTKRERGTVWLSLDDGATWPVKRVLWPGAFAYSVPTRLADGTVGVLFEADDYRRIVFARFPIAWIEKGYSQKKLPGVVPVAIETSAGAIEELDLTHAPVTGGNFLKYVDQKMYDGGRFHRAVRLDNQIRKDVKIEVVQAGRDPERAKTEQGFGPIPLERTSVTGLRHVDGALSMARTGPDTATSDFFICVGDQPSLDFGGPRNSDGQGFAAFGRVTAGMDVVRKIHAGATDDREHLVQPVVIRRVHRR